MAKSTRSLSCLACTRDKCQDSLSKREGQGLGEGAVRGGGLGLGLAEEKGDDPQPLRQPESLTSKGSRLEGAGSSSLPTWVWIQLSCPATARLTPVLCAASPNWVRATKQ